MVIAKKLKITNQQVSHLVDHFKKKARDLIFGIGINPYTDTVPLSKLDAITQ